jgi:hypothetical protein
VFTRVAEEFPVEIQPRGSTEDDDSRAPTLGPHLDLLSAARSPMEMRICAQQQFDNPSPSHGFNPKTSYGRGEYEGREGGGPGDGGTWEFFSCLISRSTIR